jgi:hypothetical protein
MREYVRKRSGSESENNPRSSGFDSGKPETLLHNQAAILKNQHALDEILANQKTILANQKTILANQKEVAVPHR